jgi:hypothetical protein
MGASTRSSPLDCLSDDQEACRVLVRAVQIVLFFDARLKSRPASAAGAASIRKFVDSASARFVDWDYAPK